MAKKKKDSKEEVRNDILSLNDCRILCELPTGSGKSKIALDFIKEKKIQGKVLIVIPRLVLISSWKDEIKKWNYTDLLERISFVTYVSLPKLAGNIYDIVIYDEAHHLSERALLGAEELVSNYTILLSATVTRKHKSKLKSVWPDLKCYTITPKQAISKGILPDPKVLLFPLSLDNTKVDCEYIVNPKAKGTAAKVSFNQRFNCFKDKSHKYIIECTQKQYYELLSFWVEKWKKLYFGTCNQTFYFLWQNKALERLKFLANIKQGITLSILSKLQNYRTLTFCSSIEQTTALGEYCINSKETNSNKYLEDFNNGSINHITACNMLNEGVNLASCQIGIFNVINSSDIMNIQKTGRILRHEKPIIIIPYYTETREEEIVADITKMYNSNLIVKMNNLEELENEVFNR